MEVLEAFDLTGSYRDAASLAGCSHHTVARYVAAREAGGQLERAAARPQLIDEFLPKVREWVKHSKGQIRADKAHEKLLAMGYEGSERTTRRAVHEAKAAFNLGQVRVHRPWVTEPGMWSLCRTLHKGHMRLTRPLTEACIGRGWGSQGERAERRCAWPSDASCARCGRRQDQGGR
jgi:transposase